MTRIGGLEKGRFLAGKDADKAPAMNGWCGQILRIDLTTGETRSECPPPGVYRENLGGRGLAGYYLAPEATRAWDDPAMPLLFFTGPLVGTAAPTSGRMTFMSRSPLTGTVGDCSVGGSFGTLLKKAGWDGIIVTGTGAPPLRDRDRGWRRHPDRRHGADGASHVGEIFACLKDKGGAAVHGAGGGKRRRLRERDGGRPFCGGAQRPGPRVCRQASQVHHRHGARENGRRRSRGVGRGRRGHPPPAGGLSGAPRGVRDRGVRHAGPLRPDLMPGG